MKRDVQPCLPTPSMLLSVILALIAANPLARSEQDDLKKLLSEAEWKAYIGSEENEGVEVIWLEDNERDRLELVTHGERLSLELEPASDLLDHRFAIISRLENASILLDPSLAEPNCHYRVPRKAALFLCRGISGVINSARNDSFYLINPLQRRLVKRSVGRPHVVVKKRFSLSSVSTLGLRLKPEMTDVKLHQSGRKKRRRKRRTGEPPPVHVETAVFVDRDLYTHMRTNFPSETEREVVKFVLTMVNAVQMLYHDPSLGQKVSFVVKRLEILHVEPTGLVRSHDIDRFLGNFCSWQKGENPGDDSNPLHWDHALILTGLDLYVLSKNGKISKQVVGLAPVAGMCTTTSSCTVNEGRHFESVYVVAHEIGHNLGMRHDGPLADNNCDPGSYLMSPTLGSGKITWSSCSRQYLQQFLQSPQSHCLMDHSTSEQQLDHSGEGLLPGERFTASQQCMLKYGRGSKHSPVQPVAEVCRDLHCTKDRYIWTSHPALEGTSCGSKKWCRNGRCVGRGVSAIYESVTGGWSEWSPFSECASGCLTGENHNLSSGSTGVMVASRLCNDPRPDNGGNPCVGSDKKYKTCQPHQCEKVPKTSIHSFADEVCLRAKEVDTDLTGTGFQKISSNPEEACTVWCHKKLGGTKSKGWTFPDGTTCQIHRDNKPLYCISGICQEFKCSSNEDEIFVIPTDMCSTTMLNSRDKRREVAVGIWIPVSDCYNNCISPGTGLRLVEKRPCRYCNTTTSIQLCESNSKRCNTIKSPNDEASAVCTRFSQKVRRLSGLGMQLSASADDPDRPCRLACQDEVVPHRFYLVNGEDGWYPFGTDCSRGDPTKKAFCISGRCMEFGSDNTPLHETVHNFFEIHRQKRDLNVVFISQNISTTSFVVPNLNFRKSKQDGVEAQGSSLYRRITASYPGGTSSPVLITHLDPDIEEPLIDFSRPILVNESDFYTKSDTYESNGNDLIY